MTEMCHVNSINVGKILRLQAHTYCVVDRMGKLNLHQNVLGRASVSVHQYFHLPQLVLIHVLVFIWNPPTFYKEKAETHETHERIKEEV